MASSQKVNDLIKELRGLANNPTTEFAKDVKNICDKIDKAVSNERAGHDFNRKAGTLFVGAPGASSTQTREAPIEQTEPQPDHQQSAADAWEYWADFQTECAHNMETWRQAMGDWAQKMELWALRQPGMLYGGDESGINANFNTPPGPPAEPTWPSSQAVDCSVVLTKSTAQADNATRPDLYDGTPSIVNQAPRVMWAEYLKMLNTPSQPETQSIPDELQTSSAAPIIVKLPKTPRLETQSIPELRESSAARLIVKLPKTPGLEDGSAPLLGSKPLHMNTRKRLMSPIAGNAKRRRIEGLGAEESKNQEDGEIDRSGSKTSVKHERTEQEPIQQECRPS